MIHLKLCKALSYSGIVSATKSAPDVFVEDEKTALAAVSTGYFKIVEGDTSTPPKVPTGTITKLDTMSVAQLKEYAKENGIDLNGATRKEDILTAIEEAEAGENFADSFIGGNGDGTTQD